MKFPSLCLLAGAQATKFTDFEEMNIDGEMINFSEAYDGRVAVVVNVASLWGYAQFHYPQLQTMFDEYESQEHRDEIYAEFWKF